MMNIKRAAQSGIAMPIMLIMLAVMLVSSIYLLRSSTSTTITTANLAYDSALSKSADLGIHTAFAWLSTVAKSQLNADVAASGYVSTLNPVHTVSTPAFWNGSVTIDDPAKENRIEYVIHRMCTFAGAYNSTVPPNSCTVTAAKAKVKAATMVGDSLSSDAPAYQGKPELHYVITSRIFGPRGGNVVNQAVVMMGP
ncbi:hypothetical protein MJ904_22775 [Massilia sp. MB5]|uniref:hypothetical protein n=1 Tax=unclassified Massilia TaxID=2609279 RepID=UPI00067B83CB|nr:MULTISPECIES: hypothetical protein [unclassified Massilia]AKU20690.1 hypothetical protein ACZ75_03345 [Massilia sp. NR 4-1]UMR29828.1 hypothetical protein MJ904_22775 [Massilia sp. MB5]